MVEVLRTNLFIPGVRGNVVPRPRLVEQLNTGLDKKLTLISTPARFGKTALGVAWLEEIDYPVEWLYLDESDNDLPRFLAYLAAVLRLVDEHIGAPLLSALQSPQLPAIQAENTNASHN
jgi:LuxR family maltose regulon positive regulatory protein